MEVMYGAVAVAYAVGGSGCDGGRDVVLGQTRRLGEAVAFGEVCGDGRGECASCAVGVDGVDARRGKACDGVGGGVVEIIDEGVAVDKVSGLEHH